MNFGILAEPLLGAIPSILMSAALWSGTAQFAALSILIPGGGIALAAGAALLANTVAVIAAGVTLLLAPVTPPGVPVLVAAAAALIGLQAPRQASAGDEA
jgi:predicted branched-subunit amino acid permease